MQYYPDIGIIASIGQLHFETSVRTVWFDKAELFYAVGLHSNNSGDLSYKTGWFFSASMFIRIITWLELKQRSFSFITSYRER